MIFKKFKESVFYSLIVKLKVLFKESFLYNFMTEASDTLCENSFILSSSLAEKSLMRFREYNSSSLNDVLFGKLKSEHVTAFAFFLMMIIPHALWNNFYAVIAAAFLCMLFLIKGNSSRDYLSPWLLCFIFSVLGGVFLSPDKGDAIRVVLFIMTAIVFMTSVKKLSDKKALLSLIKVLVFALFLMSIYAILQSILGVEVQKLLTDVDNNQGMPGRVFSTFENPNNFAEVIVLLLPFVYALFIISHEKRKKFYYAAVFCVSIAALMLTYSRSCYVSFAISLFAFVLLYKPKFVFLLVALVIVLVPFLPESVLNRILTIASTRDTSNAYRIYLWSGVLKMLRENFVCGVGTGSAAFVKAYAPFASPLAANAPHSHMLYLELFIQFGVIGGAGFFAFWFSLIRKAFTSLVHGFDDDLKCITKASVSSFLGISFAAMAEYIWFYPRVMYVFFIVLGIMLCAIKLNKKNEG